MKTNRRPTVLAAWAILAATIVALISIGTYCTAQSGDAVQGLQATWPPDLAFFQRNAPTLDADGCLDYVYRLASQASEHAADPGFQSDAVALARIALAAADLSGGHLELIRVFEPLAESGSRKVRAAGMLVAGAVYASGSSSFPTWAAAAKERLAGVVYMLPFSELARAARSIGRELNVGVPSVPWYAIVGLAAALTVTVIAVALALSGPRLSGMITVLPSRGHGSFVTSAVNLSTGFGPRQCAVFRQVGGSISIVRRRDKLGSIVSKADQGRMPDAYDGALFALFPGPGRRVMIWAPDGGQVVDDDGMPSFFHPYAELTHSCRVEIADASIEFSRAW